MQKISANCCQAGKSAFIGLALCVFGGWLPASAEQSAILPTDSVLHRRTK